MGLLFFILLVPISLLSKNYKGAELRTKESYTYGRFEARIKPPSASGYLSSFFTYHDFESSSEWNEIDVEILGRYNHNVQVTSIGPNQKIRNSHQWVPFDTHQDFHVYAFEWTPDYIAWFIDGNEVYRQDDAFIADFHYPQKIMMNIWKPAWEPWAGPWFDASLPLFSYYDYVSYAAYTPDSGHCGTGNNFTLLWKDDFDSLNTLRWDRATHTFSGNECDFTPENIVFKNGYMILCLTDNDHLGLNDVTPPTMLYAWALDSTVWVSFNESLDSLSANTAANFHIPGLNIKSAKLQNDKHTVRLLVGPMENQQTYNVVAFNIKDLARPANVQIGQVLPITQLHYLNFPVRINCGGDSIGGYLADQEWRPDRMFGHQDGYSESFDNCPDIAGSDNDSIYWTELHEAVTYKVRLPNGTYRLVLHLAENKIQEAGKRIFDIIAEGRKIAEALDPAGQYGYRQAITLTADSLLVADGILDIYLNNRKDVSLLNAIEIFPLQTGVQKSHELSAPKTFVLLPNYPNPFNGSTVLPFILPKSGNVSIQIYNLAGQRMFSTRIQNLNAGLQKYKWTASVPSGMYFVKILYMTGNTKLTKSRKIVFIK